MRTIEVPSKRGLKKRVKPKSAGRKTPSRTRQGNAEFIQHLKGLIRWVAIVPLVIFLIFLCSELALAFGNTPEEVDTRSRIITDYGPWDSTLIRALNGGITGDIENDLARYGDGSEDSFARLADPIKKPGEFTIMIVETPTATPTPKKVEETPPTEDPFITESPTPTTEEIDPETITPTSTATDTIVIAGTATVTASPTFTIDPPTITATSTNTITPTATNTFTPTASATPTLTTPTVTPVSTSSATPASSPDLCFENGGWYAMHYHTPSGAHNYVGSEFHEGHGLPDGPMALNSVIIESVNLKQEGVTAVERIEKVAVGWRNGTMQDIPWSGEASANVTIPIGIQMPYVYPALENAYRATYVTFFLGGDIDGTYNVTLTIYIPEYSQRCSLTSIFSTN